MRAMGVLLAINDCVRCHVASSWFRNQVICRLAYCRVAALARAIASSSGISPFDMRGKLRHAYGFHCRVLRGNIQGYQFPDFIQRALIHHFRKAGIDPAVKNRAIGIEYDATGVSGIDGHGSAAPLKARDRPSARHHHFQRPHDALTVCRAQPGGHLRIEPGKLGMQRFDPLLLKPRAQWVPDFGGMAGMSERPPVSARK
jgi:hypothetical protein